MPAPMPALQRFEQALLSVDRLTAQAILTEAAGDGPGAKPLEELVVPALEHIGELWAGGAAALSQVYMSGRICEELVDKLLAPGNSQRQSHPKMAVAVLEDYHVLGKRMIYSVIRASGYELLDYGRTTVASLARQATEDCVQILLVSTLMLPSALKVGALRKHLAELGSRPTIVVGGAPFRLDQELWREVGADAMGRTASEAVAIVADLAGGMA